MPEQEGIPRRSSAISPRHWDQETLPNPSEKLGNALWICSLIVSARVSLGGNPFSLILCIQTPFLFLPSAIEFKIEKENEGMNNEAHVCAGWCVPALKVNSSLTFDKRYRGTAYAAAPPRKTYVRNNLGISSCDVRYQWNLGTRSNAGVEAKDKGDYRLSMSIFYQVPWKWTDGLWKLDGVVV